MEYEFIEKLKILLQFEIRALFRKKWIRFFYQTNLHIFYRSFFRDLRNRPSKLNSIYASIVNPKTRVFSKMSFSKKSYSYQPIKHPPPEIQHCLLQPSSTSSDKPRRSTSKSPQSLLFFLIVVLLSMYIVLSVLLPEKNSWFTIISPGPSASSRVVVPSDIEDPSNILISLSEGQRSNNLEQNYSTVKVPLNLTALQGN